MHFFQKNIKKIGKKFEFLEKKEIFYYKFKFKFV